MASYRDLEVWQGAMDLVEQLYEITSRFPQTERYGLVQQIRRAAVSVPSNIAEGHGRRTAKQRYNFLENALGSVFELETQIDISRRLQMLSPDQADVLQDRIKGLGRGLTALMRHVATQAKVEKPRFS